MVQVGEATAHNASVASQRPRAAGASAPPRRRCPAAQPPEQHRETQNQPAAPSPFAAFAALGASFCPSRKRLPVTPTLSPDPVSQNANGPNHRRPRGYWVPDQAFGAGSVPPEPSRPKLVRDDSWRAATSFTSPRSQGEVERSEGEGQRPRKRLWFSLPKARVAAPHASGCPSPQPSPRRRGEGVCFASGARVPKTTNAEEDRSPASVASQGASAPRDVVAPRRRCPAVRPDQHRETKKQVPGGSAAGTAP